MKVSFNVLACVAVGAVFLALTALGLVSYHNTGELMTTADRVAASHAVLERTERMLSLLTAAEAGERGYVITGEGRYLGPYETGLEQLDRTLAELDGLTRNDPARQERLDELRPLLGKKRREMKELIRLRREEGFDAARARVMTDEGRATMSDVRRVIAALADEEDAALRRRKAEAEATARGTQRTILVGHLLLLAVLTLAGAALFREARRRWLGEERYRRLVEVCPDAIFIVRGGRIVFGNDACLKLLGAAPGQLVGKSPYEVIHPDYHSIVRQRVRAMTESGRPVPLIEEQVVRCDGGTVDVEVISSPFTDHDGPAIQVVLRDLTERKQLETRLLRTQRLESIGTLAGGIAHDLNNVLTPILMAVKLLKKERPEAQRRELLATAQASAERGADMVRQLLSFAGGAEGPREPVHLKPVIREVQTLLGHTLPKSVRIHVETAPELGLVAGDQTQLAQVLLNLCVNARDAMPQGGTLTVAAANTTVTEEQARRNAGARAGPHVLLAVTDTGAGIAPEVLDKIFDPFFTTKGQGQGTGLGLSTVLGIVRGHGGFVSVYSEPGKGSRFAVYLPALGAGAAAPEPEGRREPPAGHGELVLVIDDEEPILLTAKAVLEAHGYRAVTAPRGADGVAAYRRAGGAVRAVLVDMMMPGMDGPATMRQLLELDPGARIIAASGLMAAGRAAEAVAAGARAFLHKPYTEEQLLRALAEVLRGSGEHIAAGPRTGDG
jgi:PAS domain S-box-containing protein